VDEVDSILIDEARTPLIISGPAEGSTDRYYKIDRIIPKLTRAATIVEGKLSEIEAQAPGDYIVDEKSRAVSLTEQGITHCERLLNVDNLYDPTQMEVLHHISQALKAHALFKKDVDYVIKDGQVIIVDEFTGRMMPGRRWSDGLHQAVEAKEGVKIESENQTLATITLQNYFRMYEKLAGMTGTAATEADEFAKIYELDVTVVPTNRPMSRVNYPDVVYKTEREKFDAVSTEIAACHEKGQPALVGTVSIEKSEHLSRLLKKRGIPHQVLNAKYHEREAEIIAQAGREKAVTIATNMAGRGTDILLGGNPDFLAKELLRKKGLDPALAPPEARQAAWEEANKVTQPEHERVVKLGGLHIIGTERHESRRIDNQLRGRSGRQGDPGSSRFYLSLEDDLLRIFGSERIQRIMERLGMEEGEPIEHKLVTRAIGTAQKRVETRNFEIRKHLLEYDDVMNKQREIVYGLRRDILEGGSQEERILEWAGEVAESITGRFASRDAHVDDWDLPGLNEALYRQFDLRLAGASTEGAVEAGSAEALNAAVQEAVEALYREREQQVGPELLHRLERWILLGLRWEDGEFRGIDQLWKDDLLNMDHLKEGIGLRGYGQRDPLTEYKKEAFDMFQEMMDHLKEVVLEQLFKVRIASADLAPMQGPAPAAVREPTWREIHGRSGDVAPSEPRMLAGAKVGRNEPCPCGSGKKYKKCCLLKGV
jgi:preprotein translocase subunit SecA